MRVRYQMAGTSTWAAECDLTEKQARKRYEELKTNALCEWGELVGEEDDDYMEILEDFDHIKLARMMKSILGGL